MAVLFNNCKGRPHASIFGAGAFFDLDTHGPHVKLAVGLKPGAQCAVVSKEPDGAIRFSWYRFEREELLEDEGEKVRVFFGAFERAEVMRKDAAAKSVEYGRLFDGRGYFKRVSGVESGEA